MADQADFPDIYVDESVATGGVGSEADPYSDFSEINWTTGGDNSVFDYYDGSPSASVTINLKRGEVWRETLTIGASGTETYPLTIQAYGSGDAPYINGSDLIGTWTPEGTANVWEATLTTEPDQVLVDGNFGEPQASIVACTSDYDWYWNSNTLYVYDSSGDPDSRSSPGVEASIRAYCINASSKDYITIDGVDVGKSEYSNIFYQTCNNSVLKNITAEWGWYLGVIISSATPVASNPWSGLLVEDCIFRYNGSFGFDAATNCSDVTVRRCEAYENGRYQSGSAEHTWTGGIAGFGDGSWVSDFLYEQNYSHDNGPATPDGNASHGVGIWCDHWTGASGTENIIRHNRTEDNNSFGIYLEKNQYSRCYGNVCIRDGQITDGIGGIWAASTVSGELVANCTIYNNTIVDSGGWGLFVGNHQTDGGEVIVNNTIKNNIVVGSGAYNLYCKQGGANQANQGSGNVYENNCFGAEDTDFLRWHYNAYSTYDLWIAASSQADNNIEADPSFTAAGSDDYTLASDCPCIGEGVNLGANYVDGLLPSSTWPDGVLTGDRDNY